MYSRGGWEWAAREMRGTKSSSGAAGSRGRMGLGSGQGRRLGVGKGSPRALHCELHARGIAKL